MKSLTLLLGCALCGLSPAEPEQDATPEQPQQDGLEETFRQAGLQVDRELGLVGLEVEVLVTEDLLEYVLVGPRGQAHESLFISGVTPSILNAALLSTGAQPGQNALWKPMEEDDSGSPSGRDGEPSRQVKFEVTPPEGSGFHLYTAWREGTETYFYRLDDLIGDLRTGRSMRRHRWVFLGSRFVSPGDGEPEVFVADLEQNLVNISFFYQGNTLATAALPECREQTIWVANAWLLPRRGSSVTLLFSREPLDRLPAEWEDVIPTLPERSSGLEAEMSLGAYAEEDPASDEEADGE